jgi:UDP-2-acetamido-3-amino-2,3-dideoxy-glucuronate N-acetyltransferase
MSRHGHILKNPDSERIMRCPEAGFRYKEFNGEGLRCIDLSEDAPLPAHLAKGEQSYHDFKRPLSGR